MKLNPIIIWSITNKVNVPHNENYRMLLPLFFRKNSVKLLKNFTIDWFDEKNCMAVNYSFFPQKFHQINVLLKNFIPTLIWRKKLQVCSYFLRESVWLLQIKSKLLISRKCYLFCNFTSFQLNLPEYVEYVHIHIFLQLFCEINEENLSY